jgi:hypothetical protein
VRPLARILLAASLAVLRSAHGQDAAPPTTTTTAPEVADESVGLETPRSTMAAWRAERTLPLPEVPGDRVVELAGTLDWPLAGSPDRRDKR